MKATITVKGRKVHTKNVSGSRKSVAKLARGIARFTKDKVLVHFEDEMHPVHIKVK